MYTYLNMYNLTGPNKLYTLQCYMCIRGLCQFRLSKVDYAIFCLGTCNCNFISLTAATCKTLLWFLCWPKTDPGRESGKRINGRRVENREPHGGNWRHVFSSGEERKTLHFFGFCPPARIIEVAQMWRREGYEKWWLKIGATDFFNSGFWSVKSGNKNLPL